MAEIEIEKLKLKLVGGSASEPKSLTTRIAQQLAQAALPAVSQKLGGLQISITAAQGETEEALTRRIVVQILRQLDAAS